MYENRSVSETICALQTDEAGLSSGQAAERLTKYGPNRLKDQEKKSLGRRIAEQLNDPLILILMVAMAISMMLNECGGARHDTGRKGRQGGGGAETDFGAESDRFTGRRG